MSNNINLEGVILLIIIVSEIYLPLSCPLKMPGSTNPDVSRKKTVYYTSPQSFVITFCYSLAQQLWWVLLNFDWLANYIEGSKF